MRGIVVITVFVVLAGIVAGVGFEGTVTELKDAQNDPVFWNELGYQLSQEGNLHGAQSAFSQAIALDPAYVNARENFYVAAFHNEEYLLAAEHAKILLDEHGDAQYHFDYAQALVMWSRGQPESWATTTALEEALVHLEAAGDYPHAEENAMIVRNVLSR